MSLGSREDSVDRSARPIEGCGGIHSRLCNLPWRPAPDCQVAVTCQSAKCFHLEMSRKIIRAWNPERMQSGILTELKRNVNGKFISKYKILWMQKFVFSDAHCRRNSSQNAPLNLARSAKFANGFIRCIRLRSKLDLIQAVSIHKRFHFSSSGQVCDLKA